MLLLITMKKWHKYMIMNMLFVLQRRGGETERRREKLIIIEDFLCVSLSLRLCVLSNLKGRVIHFFFRYFVSLVLTE